MIDLDYGPGVFAMWIIIVVLAPALYGLLFVDKYWEQHQKENSNDDVFN
ncbi:MAG: hypothetical protein OEY38_17290 [Gammaproteobacteria bacterium]|nr:hypothetical protein [Gammaproteobacteria bacterium]